MKYLLDTHVILWANLTPSRLSEEVKTIILDPNAKKFVSIVSAWEVAVKLGTGKLSIDGGLPEFYHMIDRNGFISLGVERAYISRLSSLQTFHRDPFDRMLIATALTENLTLVTIDQNIQKYSVSHVW